MRGALYTVADLALWLRVPREEVERMVDQDGLPSMELGGKERPKVKFAPRHLCDYFNRTSGYAWTIEQLIEDIDRVIEAAAKERKQTKKGEPAAV